MLKPTFFVPLLLNGTTDTSDHFMQNRPTPKTIIILGSVLTMAGLVGLSVLGFIIFKDIKAEENTGPSSI